MISVNYLKNKNFANDATYPNPQIPFLSRQVLISKCASAVLMLVYMLTYSTLTQAEDAAVMFSGSEGYVVSQGPKAFPEDGVIFGTPPDDNVSTAIKYKEIETLSAIIAEYEVRGGFVRFIDEGNGISTLIKGGSETFKAISGANTVGELFQLVAPVGTYMPREIRGAQLEPLTQLKVVGGSSNGPTLEEEFETGEDDWANGCNGNEFNQWSTAFNNWRGPLFGNEAFSTSDHWQTNLETIDSLVGYFGTIDEIWFAGCLVEGPLATIQIERRQYEYCDENGCGAWSGINGTYAVMGPGDRYMYHNHSHYSPMRRVDIHSLISSENGWEYFFSAAGLDTFLADDQYQSAD